MTDGDRLSWSHPTTWAPVLYDVLVLDDKPAVVDVDPARVLRRARSGLTECWPDPKQPGWML